MRSNNSGSSWTGTTNSPRNVNILKPSDMTTRHLWNLLFHRKAFSRPATVTKENIKGFLQGNLRSVRSKIGFLQPDHCVQEQVWWRLSLVNKNSPECIMRGQCRVCGCSTDEIVFEDRPCKGLCYPAMKTETEWEEFKHKNNIHIEQP